MTSENNFRYQPNVAVSGNLGGKVLVADDVLSSHEQQLNATTSLDVNSIEFEFQTYRNYNIDLRQSYSALKVKLVNGRGYHTHTNRKKLKTNTKTKKSRQKQQSMMKRMILTWYPYLLM